jgi:hypothetical protein
MGHRHRVVGAVVLSDAEDVEPDLVGELDFLEQVAEPPTHVGLASGSRVEPGLCERVDADLHDVGVVV